jgi:AraC-like DNA-binding protein
MGKGLPGGSGEYTGDGSGGPYSRPAPGFPPSHEKELSLMFQYTRKSFGSLYFKMSISYILIILVVVLSISVITSNVYARKIERELSLKNSLVLEQIKDNIDQYILQAADNLIVYYVGTDADITKLFRAPVRSNEIYVEKTYAKISNLISSNPLYHSIFVYYQPNGLIVSNLGTFYLNERVNRGNEFDWLTHPPADSRNKWIPIRGFKALSTVDDSIAKDVISYVRTYPLGSDAGNAKGTIAVNIDADKLFAQMRSLTSAAFGEVYILDDTGNVLFRNQAASEQDEGNSLLQFPIREGANGFTFKEDDREYAAFTTASSVNQWRYVNLVPMELYEAEVRALHRIAYRIAAATIVVFAAIALFWAKRLYRPFGELVRRSRAISRELLQKEDDGIRDVKSLDVTLNQLVDKITEMQSRFRIDEPKVRNAFLQRLFENKSIRREDIEFELMSMQLSFPFSRFACIAIVPERKGVESDTIRSNLVYYMENTETAGCVKLATDMYDGVVMALVNADEDGTIERLARTLLAYGESKSIRFAIGIGASVDRLELVHQSYAGARDCLKYGAIKMDLSLFTARETAVWDQSGRLFPEAYNLNLERNLNEGNPDLIRHDLELIFKELGESDYAFATVQAQVVYLSSLYQKKQRILDCIALPKPLDLHTADLNEAKALLTAATDVIVEAMREQREKKWHIELEQMKKYIRDNIHRGRWSEISLIEVADQFKKNPNYVSKIFSDGTGTNFKDYIVNLKLEKAERSLHDPNIKIKDLAKELGYENVSYFIRIFKRKYGCTPKDYFMKIHQKKDDAG